MVLTGCEGRYVFTVYHDDERGFFAVQELFNNNTAAGLAKGVASQHIANSVFRFLQGHRHDDAFTSRQAVGFNHDRRTFFTNVGQSRLDLGEVLVLSSRNVVTGEEVFGKRF